MRKPSQAVGELSPKALALIHPNSYIFTASGIKLFDGSFISSTEVIKERLKRGYWPLNEGSNHRKRFKRGDMVLFYTTRPLKTFIAVASIHSQCITLSIRQRDKLEAEFDHLLGTPYIVEIGNPVFLLSPVPINSVIEELDFISNKTYWWVYFQGGITKIEPQDFELILNKGVTEYYSTTEKPYGEKEG